MCGTICRRAKALGIILLKGEVIQRDLVSVQLLPQKIPSALQRGPREVQQRKAQMPPFTTGSSSGEATAQSPGSSMLSLPQVMVSP